MNLKRSDQSPARKETPTAVKALEQALEALTQTVRKALEGVARHDRRLVTHLEEPPIHSVIEFAAPVRLYQHAMQAGMPDRDVVVLVVVVPG